MQGLCRNKHAAGPATVPCRLDQANKHCYRLVPVRIGASFAFAGSTFGLPILGWKAWKHSLTPQQRMLTPMLDAALPRCRLFKWHCSIIDAKTVYKSSLARSCSSGEATQGVFAHLGLLVHLLPEVARAHQHVDCKLAGGNLQVPVQHGLGPRLQLVQEHHLCCVQSRVEGNVRLQRVLRCPCRTRAVCSTAGNNLQTGWQSGSAAQLPRAFEMKHDVTGASTGHAALNRCGCCTPSRVERSAAMSNTRRITNAKREHAVSSSGFSSWLAVRRAMS